MVEIPLIRKSGRSSNSFFSRARVQFQQPRLHILLPALIALGIVCLFTWRQSELWQIVDRASRDMQTINMLAQQSQKTRSQIDQFLISAQREDFTAATQALTGLIQKVRDRVLISDEPVYYDFQTLEITAQTALNTIRSLDTLAQAGSLAGSAQLQLRQNVQQTAQQLVEHAESLSLEATSAFQATLQRVQSENSQLQLALFIATLLLILIGVVGYLHLTHATNGRLEEITQAIQAITEGNYNKQSLTTRRDSIGKLAAAFNNMAANLQTALQTESAANEQNRRQIIKLAQQERMTAILEERQRIARELHDSVKQQLFSITLATGAAINLIDHDANLARTYLTHVQQMGTSAQSEMTTLLQEMAPVPLHDQHLEDALYQYLAPLCELHNLKLLWRVEGTNTLTIAQEHALFRIVQEATANVIRHSKAIVLRISLRFGLQTTLVIEDDGHGFDPEAIPRTSTGLATMRLRVRQVGGRLTLNSIIGQGTKLEIILDLRRKL